MSDMKHTLLVSIAALIGFTACSQDDISSPAGTSPLTLTAAIEGEATTRATVDGTWEAEDAITLSIDANTYTYQYGTEGWTSSAPYFWQEEDTPISVSAYSFGGKATGAYAVQADQSTDDSYLSGDLLYAPAVEVTYKAEASLTFYHQTAKVVVHVKNDGYLSGNWNHGDVSMTIGENNNINLSGTFTPFSGVDRTAGTWNNLGTPGTITPHDAALAANCAASFEALVIPQNITAGTTLFQFKVGGGDPFRYKVPEAGITWETGKVYTYNITLTMDGTVTVDNGIGLPDGWENEEEL